MIKNNKYGLFTTILLLSIFSISSVDAAFDFDNYQGTLDRLNALGQSPINSGYDFSFTEVANPASAKFTSYKYENGVLVPIYSLMLFQHL